MSQYGHEIYGQFETLMAVDGEPARIDFHRAGYLWLGSGKADIDALMSLDTDRILRAFASLVQATLRTNYFVTREGSARARDVLALKLDAQLIDELVLLVCGQLQVAAALCNRSTRALDSSERCAIEVHIWGPHVEYACFEHRLLRRNGQLLIDEMSDSGLTRAGYQRLAYRLQSGRLRGGQGLHRRALGPRRAR